MQRVALRARRLARIQAQCAKAAGTSSSKYYTEAAVLHRLERTLTLAVTLTLTRSSMEPIVRSRRRLSLWGVPG